MIQADFSYAVGTLVSLLNELTVPKATAKDYTIQFTGSGLLTAVGGPTGGILPPIFLDEQFT